MTRFESQLLSCRYNRDWVLQDSSLCICMGIQDWNRWKNVVVSEWSLMIQSGDGTEKNMVLLQDQQRNKAYFKNVK